MVFCSILWSQGLTTCQGSLVCAETATIVPHNNPRFTKQLLPSRWPFPLHLGVLHPHLLRNVTRASSSLPRLRLPRLHSPAPYWKGLRVGGVDWIYSETIVFHTGAKCFTTLPVDSSKDMVSPTHTPHHPENTHVHTQTQSLLKMAWMPLSFKTSTQCWGSKSHILKYRILSYATHSTSGLRAILLHIYYPTFLKPKVTATTTLERGEHLSGRSA